MSNFTKGLLDTSSSTRGWISFYEAFNRIMGDLVSPRVAVIIYKPDVGKWFCCLPLGLAHHSLWLRSQGEHTPPVYLYTDHFRVSLLACSKVRRNEGRADRRTAIHGELVRDDDSSRFVKTPCADGASTYSPWNFHRPKITRDSPPRLVIMRSADRLTL